MILFIRDNECFEPRVQNYLRYFKDNNIPHHVIAWNRNGKAKYEDNITFFERRAEYGKRIANIPNKIAWMLFVIKEIWKYRKVCTSIHACDIDAVIPALIVGKALNKIVAFDIFDWISSLTGKGFVYKVVELLQNFAYRHSDVVILCEEERKEQAKVSNDNIMIIPNVPDGKIIIDKETFSDIEDQKEAYKLVISYVGVFDRDRGLENLLECVSENSQLLLNIAGFGVLEDLVNDYADKHSNICYWGRVDYAIGQTIMKNSDLIAAMYHLTSPLHKYAAPNKYYESLFLEVPLITTKDTLVGSKVGKYDTGFILGETKKELYDLLIREDLKAEILIKKKNCKEVWNNIYSTYYGDYMNNSYMRLLKLN